MSTVILDLEAERVLAVEASLSRDRVRVKRAFTETVPVSVREEGTAEAIGRWVRERLDEHGMKAKSAIIAAARAEVLVKRLDAPGEALSRSERHEMIRLQMSRQASMTSASSVIDYVEYDATEDEAGFVVASAMPTDRVRGREETARAADLKLEGIRLRTAGVRALLSQELDPSCSTLVVNPGTGSVELLMLIGGEIVFSRSVSVGLPENGEAADEFAEKVAVEATRTLVSFRVSADGREIDRAVVLAGNAIGKALSSAIGERLDIPAQTLDPASLIDFDEGIDQRQHPAIAPLAGLLLCKARGIKAHDFANPTAPPDTTAGLRQGVLAGMLVLILLGGAGFVLGQRTLASAKRERDAAEEAAKGAYARYMSRQLEGARLGHIRAWTDDPIDWPAHLANIVSMLPDAEAVALGQISVGLNSQARFEAGEALGDLDAWGAQSVMTLSISGATRDRAYVNALRERLLSSGIYTVTSQGPELDDRFSLQIATAVPTPVAAESEDGEEAADGASADGGEAG